MGPFTVEICEGSSKENDLNFKKYHQIPKEKKNWVNFDDDDVVYIKKKSFPDFDWLLVDAQPPPYISIPKNFRAFLHCERDQLITSAKKGYVLYIEKWIFLKRS